MEKIILVHYITIGNMATNDVSRFMKEMVERFKLNGEDNIISYFIPIRDGDTRIECINPKLVSEEDYKQAIEVLDRNQKIVDEIVLENNK